ncbi:MAG: ZIP family metal transporter [Acidobacteriota bacterium]|nr:ZIP family metal transporter [Acidobacteriota bacterium]MDE3190187.1 ZIP family metal transporter [Acidobacteriota bacterium]
MSTGHILLLGAIAGATIFLGLPMGRVRGLSANARSGLSAFATGILVFLLWDVLTNAVDPIQAQLHAHHWGRFAGLAGLGAGGFTLGLMSLVYYDAWMKRRAHRRATNLVGPGAAAIDEFTSRSWLDLTSPAVRLAFLIAIGIGVHNFGEGLAIGQAAAASEISLAVTLIIGFGLHNATEGFGICGPLAGEGIRPSWKLLGLLGLIGGAPTFLGTVVGQAWTSDVVSVVFFAVAGGSILYVVGELFAVNRRYGHPVLVTWLMLAGIAAGFATDFVVTAAGV